jgi:DNA-binding MarR family transcriptional regulator
LERVLVCTPFDLRDLVGASLLASWTKVTGMYGPQWMVLAALRELDLYGVVCVDAIARRLNVDRSFVIAQSKCLERRGLLKVSKEGRCIIKLRLTEKTHAAFESVSRDISF